MWMYLRYPHLLIQPFLDIFVVLSLMEMEKRSRVRSFSYHRQTRQAEQLDVTNLTNPDKHLVSLSCSTAHEKIRSSCRQNTESPRWPFKSFGLAHFFAESIQQTSVPTTIWQLPWPCCVFWQNGFILLYFLTYDARIPLSFLILQRIFARPLLLSVSI